MRLGRPGSGRRGAWAAEGIDYVVCAPGLIPRGATDRVKTDRRDAERLVRLLVAGELHRVVVPSVEEEALRDLVRAREDLRSDLMRARHRLAKLLLGGPPRAARSRDRRGAARLAVGADRAAADVPARDRHLTAAGLCAEIGHF